MSRATLVHVVCDFCGYGGAWTRPEDFVEVGTYDLCKWCAQQPATREVSCGRHTVTIAGDDFTCSCGATRQSEFPGFLLSVDPRTHVVPNVVCRLAAMHAETA